MYGNNQAVERAARRLWTLSRPTLRHTRTRARPAHVREQPGGRAGGEEIVDPEPTNPETHAYARETGTCTGTTRRSSGRRGDCGRALETARNFAFSLAADEKRRPSACQSITINETRRSNCKEGKWTRL